jgi:hypothetical protein
LAADLPYQFHLLNLSEVIIDGQKLNFIESERENKTVWRDLQEWKIKVALQWVFCVLYAAANGVILSV